MPLPPFRWSAATPAQRRTLIAAALGWMLDAFDVMLYSIVLTHLMAHFGMTRGTAGLLNSLTLLASAVGSFGFGLLADRFGRRRMLTFSVLTYSIFTFACGFSTSVFMLAAFRLLLGLGMGGEWNCGAALVAETWPAALRGRALGIVQSSWAIGYAAAALVAGFVLAHANWRFVFFVGIVPAGLVLWIRRAVPESEVWSRERALPSSNLGPLWRSSLRPLLILLAMNTFGMFAWWGLFTWIPAYLVSMRGDLTRPLVVLNLCGMLPGYLLFGGAADRFGRRRTLVVYLALAAISVPLFAAARGELAMLASGIVAAFFGTGFFTGSAIVGSELFPTPIRAAALGVSYNVARGFSALAPFAIGRFSDRHGLSGGFLFCGLAFALAAVAAAGLPETMQSEDPIRRIPRARFLWLFLGSILCIPVLMAAPSDAVLPPVRDMKLMTETTGWVLAGQKIFWTNTGGRSWVDITPPLSSTQALNSTFFLDSDHGWAVLHEPGAMTALPKISIASTTDGGKSWSVNELHGDEFFLDGAGNRSNFSFVDASRGWVVFQKMSGSLSIGDLFATVDGGKTWAALPRPPAFGDIQFFPDGTGFLVDTIKKEGLYRTTDGGRTWMVKAAPLPEGVRPYSMPEGMGLTYVAWPSYEGAHFANAREGIVEVLVPVKQVGDLRQLIYSTDDGGDTWTLQTTPETEYDGGVLAFFNSTLVRVSHPDSQLVLRQGVRSATLPLPRDVPKFGFGKADFIDAQHGWLLGGRGELLSVSPAGVNFLIQSPVAAPKPGPMIRRPIRNTAR